MSARKLFKEAGFTGEALDIALGVSRAESSGYSDAVGDVSLVDNKWGPSIGLFQIRSLRNPLAFSEADFYRYSWALRHPCFNASAAYAISKQGTDWSPWTMYRNGKYLEFAGQDYDVQTGHVRRDLWSS